MWWFPRGYTCDKPEDDVLDHLRHLLIQKLLQNSIILDKNSTLYASYTMNDLYNYRESQSQYSDFIMRFNPHKNPNYPDGGGAFTIQRINSQLVTPIMYRANPVDANSNTPPFRDQQQLHEQLLNQSRIHNGLFIITLTLASTALCAALITTKPTNHKTKSQPSSKSSLTTPPKLYLLNNA